MRVRGFSFIFFIYFTRGVLFKWKKGGKSKKENKKNKKSADKIISIGLK